MSGMGRIRKEIEVSETYEISFEGKGASTAFRVGDLMELFSYYRYVHSHNRT